MKRVIKYVLDVDDVKKYWEVIRWGKVAAETIDGRKRIVWVSKNITTKQAHAMRGERV